MISDVFLMNNSVFPFLLHSMPLLLSYCCLNRHWRKCPEFEIRIANEQGGKSR